MRVLIVVLVAAGLVGCSAAPVVPQKPIPASLTVSCGSVNLEGNTWGDVLLAYKEAKHLLEQCNSRLKAIRELAE